LSRELLLIYLAAFVRSFGIGLLGVVLGVYLFRAGFDSTYIGFVLAAGLAGGTAATALVGMHGDRLGRRRTLCWLPILACIGCVGLAIARSFALLLALAFVGMLNGMGTDRSATFALEQAVIPGLVSERNRTWALSWYNVLLDTGGALGALAGALPHDLSSWAQFDLTLAYKYTFFGYAALQLLSAVLYAQLSPGIEVGQETSVRNANDRIGPETRSIVRRLAALFSLDAFAGGFLGDALVAYWFFRRFGVDERQLGLLFFSVHLLNAASHLGAAWLSRRIGLVKTMVFTHLPSSVLLIAVPFAPSLKIAVALFLLRESLVEMDVPTRQSYVAAVVRPHERTFASGITNLTRTLSWAGGASFAGALMQNLAFSAPLILGGSLKIGYDLLLYRGFRSIRPPEEVLSSASPFPSSKTFERTRRQMHHDSSTERKIDYAR
jgi:MFS family permease